jgi:monomeric isocitrate dehydrogenase
MAEKFPDGTPRSNGIIVGFMAGIGDVLACIAGLATKAPPAINPKLAAIAAKLDAAQAHLRAVKARDDPDDPEELEVDKAHARLFKLEDKLAEVVATNLDEMKLKARWADIASGDHTVTDSIIRDLRALGPKPEGGAYYPCEEPEPW